MQHLINEQKLHCFTHVGKVLQFYDTTTTKRQVSQNYYSFPPKAELSGALV